MRIQLMMDDFGTGYSSLNMLSTIPVDFVKIDKSLGSHCGPNVAQPFLRDVIALVHDLGKKIVCEGVETRGEYENLEKLRCDYIQGYYFGRPQGPDQAAETMRKDTLFPET